jgi:hypothetical protein
MKRWPTFVQAVERTCASEPLPAQLIQRHDRKAGRIQRYFPEDTPACEETREPKQLTPITTSGKHSQNRPQTLKGRWIG